MITPGIILLALLAPGAPEASQVKHIGAIEFFGYSGVDIAKVRACLPFHEKDEFSIETFVGTMEKAGDAVMQVTGRPPMAGSR